MLDYQQVLNATFHAMQDVWREALPVNVHLTVMGRLVVNGRFVQRLSGRKL